MKYLLEIGVEELPPSMMRKSFSEIKDLTRKFISENEIICGECYFGMTPRRIVVFIEDIKPKTKDNIVELKGPPKKICYKDNGEINKPLEAFLSKNDLKSEDINFITNEKGSWAYAKKEIPGKPVETILKLVAPTLIDKVNFRKTMTWGEGKHHFVRPVRWVVSMIGNKNLQVNIAGVESSNKTYSGGINRNKEIPIDGVSSYFELMDKEGIILSPKKRKEEIRSQLSKIASEMKAKYDDDDDLIEEISFLVEIPFAIKASFDSKFLALPDEVLIESMKKNQKFIVFKQNYKVINTFVGFFNGVPNENTVSIVKNGYKRVLVARLSDAKYFYQKDLDTDFNKLYEKLDGILYHHNLSTVKRKTDNIKEIALFLNKKIGFNIEEDKIISTCKYLKTDLLTEMVNEFPKLQGIMGKIYINKIYNLPEESTAVFEHYLPRYKDDILPDSRLGILMSISDKLETLYGSVTAKMKVSGSKDPYGIRRTSNGLLEIISNKKIDLNINEIISLLSEVFSDLIEKNSGNVSEVNDKFSKYVLSRAKQYFIDNGFRYDFVESVLNIDEMNFYKAQLKLNALIKVSNTVDVNKIVIPAVRIKNILKDYSGGLNVNEKLLVAEEEKYLYKFYKKQKNMVENYLLEGNYVDSINTVLLFSEALDNFFDNVHVNADNFELKENRFKLLNCLRTLFYSVIDFSSIVKEG